MNVLERMFPGWALRRYAARAQLVEAQRLFDISDAAKAHRYPTLRGRGYSADDVMKQVGTKHRDFARYQDENNDLAIAILDAMVNQFAPVEPTPMVLGANREPDERRNEQIAELWAEMTESGTLAADHTPWNEYKRQVGRAWLRDGEVFLRPLRGPTPEVDHLTDVPYTLSAYEAEFCPEWVTEEPDVVQGVRVNRWGRPTGYLFHSSHPGPGGTFARATGLSSRLRDDLVELPAADVWQLKFARRPSQVRGVTVLHGVQTRLLDLKDYEESERIAAKIASSFAAVLKRPMSFGFQSTYTPSGSRSIELEPGMIMDFAGPGEEIQTIDTNRPSAQIMPFRQAMMRAAAAGSGTSYSTVARDYEGSYSSQRQELVEARPQYDRLRSYWISAFLSRVYADVIGMGVLTGRIDARGLSMRELTRATYDGALQPWIDPQREAAADELAVRNGFKSRQQVIRERNGNPRHVDAELARDTFQPIPPAAAGQPSEPA